jgi:hypothetical protein
MSTYVKYQIKLRKAFPGQKTVRSKTIDDEDMIAPQPRSNRDRQ